MTWRKPSSGIDTLPNRVMPAPSTPLASSTSSAEVVPRDRVEAYKWLSLAAANWEPFGRDRDQLAGKMKPSRIGEARRRVREWKPRSWEELKREEEKRQP